MWNRIKLPTFLFSGELSGYIRASCNNESWRQPLFQIFPKLNTCLYCQFSPFFEICIGPNFIWEVFGITVRSSGLIIITGSSLYTVSFECLQAFLILWSKPRDHYTLYNRLKTCLLLFWTYSNFPHFFLRLYKRYKKRSRSWVGSNQQPLALQPETLPLS